MGIIGNGLIAAIAVPAAAEPPSDDAVWALAQRVNTATAYEAYLNRHPDGRHREADVKTGDLVVTSGIDGIYPKGFVIGTIDHVAGSVGEYHEISVRPAVDFARIEEVLIVRTPPASREAIEPTRDAPPASPRPRQGAAQ